MRRLLSLFVLLMAAPFLDAGEMAAIEYDRVMKEYVDFSDELVSVLASARDTTTADAAAPRLEALMPRLFELREKIRKLPTPDAASARDMENKYSLTMRTKWGKVFDEIYRLQAVACHDSERFRKSFATMCLILR